MAPILTLEKISKRFGAVVVANGIDLTLGQGEALSIIGPNGAGKTTLFGMITGTITPDAGRVVYDGRDISRDKPEHRCRVGIARSFQIPQPFGGMTVFETHAGSLLTVLGGLLLVLPGFITDAIGLLLLVAPLRSWLTRTFGGAVSRHAQQSRRQDGVVDLDPDEWQRVPDRELPGRPKPPRRGEPD